MTKFQKIAFFIATWLSSCGLMVIHLDAYLNLASNPRAVNVAVIAGGSVIWAILMAVGYKLVSRMV